MADSSILYCIKETKLNYSKETFPSETSEQNSSYHTFYFSSSLQFPSFFDTRVKFSKSTITTLK